MRMPSHSGDLQLDLPAARAASGAPAPSAATREAQRDTARRDRVTIDLRGRGQQLQAHASYRQMTVAALVRHAVIDMLNQKTCDAGDSMPIDSAGGTRAVKVTLRLTAFHAVMLARRARSADVSQGTYVAGLIDGTPAPQRAPDHARAVAALLASTDRLAAMNVDLNAFMRLLRCGSSEELQRYRAGIMSLADDVRQHLGTAAALMAEFRAARGRR